MGAATVSDLPAGFVLDDHALPAGFTLDKPSIGEDAAKSIGSGLASATAGTLGMFGDERNLLSSATDWAGNKLGVSPDKVKAFKDLASKAAQFTPATSIIANAPTSQDIVNSAPNPIVSPNYQPQTILGGYLKTGAEFAPGALLGEGGITSRVVKNTLLPVLGSETAGQLTKGTALEPFARIAGGFASPSFLPKGASNAALTGEKLLSTGGNEFNQARDMNVVVKPQFTSEVANKMRDALQGYDPETNPVFKAVNRLDNLGKPPVQSISPADRLQAEMNWEQLPAAPPPSPVSMNDVELIRKQLGELRTSADGPTRSAAKAAQEVLTDSQANLKPSDVLAGSAEAYSQKMKDAIGNYAAGKRSLIIQGKQNLADLNAGTAGSGANIDNNTRQAFKQLARPMNNTNVPVAKKLGFNDQEIAAIKQAATGTTTGNIARFLGKAAPTGIVSADLSAHAGGALGGPIGAVALPAAGYIAKKIGDLSTKKAVTALNSLVMSRSPLARQVAAQLPDIAQQLSPKARLYISSSLSGSDPLRVQQQ